MTDPSMLHYHIKHFTSVTGKFTLRGASPGTMTFFFIITEEINNTA